MTADTAGSYTSDGAEQMTTVTQGGNTFDYKYADAGQNEVLEQERSSTSYQLVYGRTNHQGEAVIEQAKAGANTAYVESDPATGQPPMLRTSTGTVSFYVYSGTGNPVDMLTDFNAVAFAYQYDPYGVPVVNENNGGTGLPQNPSSVRGSDTVFDVWLQNRHRRHLGARRRNGLRHGAARLPYKTVRK